MASTKVPDATLRPHLDAGHSQADTARVSWNRAIPLPMPSWQEDAALFFRLLVRPRPRWRRVAFSPEATLPSGGAGLTAAACPEPQTARLVGCSATLSRGQRASETDQLTFHLEPPDHCQR